MLTTTFNKHLLGNKNNATHTFSAIIIVSCTSPSLDDDNVGERTSRSEPISEPSEGLAGELGVCESPDCFLSGLLSCSLPLLGLFEGLGPEFFTEAELAVRLMGLEASGGMFLCKADDFRGDLKVDCDFCCDVGALP